MEQAEIVWLEQLVPANHSYRKYKEIWNFKPVFKELKKMKKNNPHEGCGLDKLFMCLLLAVVCGFSLLNKTPDHTVFTRARDRIGTKRIAKIFRVLHDQLRIKDYMNLITKSQLWKERDEALRQKYEELNNEALPKVGEK